MSYFRSTVHIRCEPHRFVGSGSGFGPPGFAGNVGWIGRDAGFTTLHIAEDPDGILCTSLIWINPVVTCKLKTEAK